MPVAVRTGGSRGGSSMNVTGPLSHCREHHESLLTIQAYLAEEVASQGLANSRRSEQVRTEMH